jgi:lipopolysaccharide/colanic/teichoic acid biosynthesis glycosyltransferase
MVSNVRADTRLAQYEHGLALVPASSIPAHLRTARASTYQRFGKRAFDLIIAAILLVVLLIPLLIALIAIRAETKGHPIFRQRRLGHNGTQFVLLKLRTMVNDAELVLIENPQLKDAMAVRWKIRDDPRVTRIGRILRNISADEVPQLVNVIRGEMSLVGPRPYLPHELNDEFGAHARLITSVRPGMTGLWQVSGRSNLMPIDRILFDEHYVARVNFATDLLILGKTFLDVLRAIGAH